LQRIGLLKIACVRYLAEAEKIENEQIGDD
jgi:hypothetical protein